MSRRMAEKTRKGGKNKESGTMENRQFWESVGWETMGRRGAGRIRLGVNKVAGASRSSSNS